MFVSPGGESGQTEESLSVLLSFQSESLPDKVMLGYISYPVRAFVPNPLQCFRCHVYGTEDCLVLVDKVVVLTVGVPMLLGIGSVRCKRGRLKWLESE